MGGHIVQCLLVLALGFGSFLHFQLSLSCKFFGFGFLFRQFLCSLSSLCFGFLLDASGLLNLLLSSFGSSLLLCKLLRLLLKPGLFFFSFLNPLSRLLVPLRLFLRCLFLFLLALSLLLHKSDFLLLYELRPKPIA